MKGNHRQILCDTAEMLDLTRLEVFQMAYFKTFGGEDSDDKALSAYHRFEWNGQAPEHVVDWCLDTLVPKPQTHNGKKARKLSMLNKAS